MEVIMDGIIIARHIEDFNNAITNLNKDSYLACFVGEAYEYDQSLQNLLFSTFEIFPDVSAVYTDIKNNIIAFPPFAPNKYFSSFILESPIVVRTSIGEHMDSTNYNSFFDKIRFKKLSYHLPFSLFIKK
jgi:hypothetical protein